MTSGPIYRGTSFWEPRPPAERQNPVWDVARSRIVAALRSCFNFLALNLVLVMACLAVFTVPAALNAATVALDRWRIDGEDRVVREFVAAFRCRAFWPTSVATGVPGVAAAIAVEEVHYFARGGALINWICLGFGASALAISIASGGYALLICARQPSLPVTDVWALSVRLGLKNLFISGPLFVLAWGAAVFAGILDPALLLIGLPLALVASLRWSADRGLVRSGLARSSGQASG